jgi:Fe-S oxidoreductase
VSAQEKIGAKQVVLSPCGHGYKVLRWDAERTLGRALPFKVVSFVEAVDGYIREGRLKLKRGTLDGRVTYHDPCNIARNGGVLEEPRRILRQLTSEFVEMAPHGAMNFCCGGGGGLAATGEYGKTRIGIGHVKAKQIQQTGASVIVTNCFNCNTQLKELNSKHGLELEVKPIIEAVADAVE